jgi:hypothetical protein
MKADDCTQTKKRKIMTMTDHMSNLRLASKDDQTITAKACRVVVLEDCELDLSWIRSLESLQKITLIQRLCRAAAPLSSDLGPQANLSLANASGDVGRFGAGVELERLGVGDVSLIKALARLPVGASDVPLSSVSTAFGVDVDWEPLQVNHEIQSLQPPSLGLAFVQLRKLKAVFNVVLGKAGLAAKPTEVDVPFVQGVENGAAGKLEPETPGAKDNST